VRNKPHRAIGLADVALKGQRQPDPRADSSPRAGMVNCWRRYQRAAEQRRRGHREERRRGGGWHDRVAPHAALKA
jgi:hypothetical protein